MQNYTRLTEAERWHIALYRESGKSIGWIAKALRRCFSTISRELRRNGTESGAYEAPAAHGLACERVTGRNRRRRKVQGALLEQVHDKLAQYWSPVQISGWLKTTQGIGLSHETIYKAVVHDPCHAWHLRPLLRHGGRRYQRRDRQKYAGRGIIPGRRDIAERPAVVEEKSRIGDWELDTIVGAGHQGYLVSMVERHSKYTLLQRVADSKAETVKNAILAAMQRVKEKVITLTADNGKEFTRHQEIADHLEADFFFATPYHSWERGLNEHTNGLVRQFFPKNTNFLRITDQQVSHVQNLLNTRPRKALNFLSPQQVFAPT